MLYVNPPSQVEYRPATALKPGSAAREAETLKEYEQLFLFQMLKEMRKTVPENALLDGGSRQAYFEEMLDDFLAGEMAASGQLGVAKQMAQQLHAPGAPAATAADRGKEFTLEPDRGAGTPLVKPASGIAIANDRPPAMEIRRPTPGIPLNAGIEAGIALNRGRVQYRAQP